MRINPLLYLVLFVLGTLNPVKAQLPTRIVSLAPSLTKIVYYLEADNQLMGVTSFCQQPEHQKKELVASAVKVNLEKIISLKPDLVITTTMTDPESIKMLRNMGIKVEAYPTPSSFDEINDQFMHLGKLLGKENKAREIVRQSKEKVEAVRIRDKNPSPKIFFQIGAKPLFSVIPGTFMDDYITFSGGVNIAKNPKVATITREAVIASAPDVIVVVTMGIVGEQEVNTWKQYTGIPAVKQNRVIVVDADMACSPTPIDFANTMEFLHRSIH
jgi:ABC-type Fe3+-hydroxamate transport system substrate-binding protein